MSASTTLSVTFPTENVGGNAATLVTHRETVHISQPQFAILQATIPFMQHDSAKHPPRLFNDAGPQ